jgi:hypothetical protein
MPRCVVVPISEIRPIPAKPVVVNIQWIEEIGLDWPNDLFRRFSFGRVSFSKNQPNVTLAKDKEAAIQIKNELEANPVNPRGRFVNFEVSTTGFQVTKS